MGESGKGLKTYKILLGMLAFIIVLGVGFALGMRFEQRFAGEMATTSVTENRELPSSNGESDSAESKKDDTSASVSRNVSNETRESKGYKDNGLTGDSEKNITVDLFKDLPPFTGEIATEVVISGVNYDQGYIVGGYPLRWNLGGNFKTVKLAIGVPDYTYYSRGSCDVFLDEKFVGHYAVSKDGGLKDFTVNVAGGRILVVSGSSNAVAVVKAVGEKKE